ncbi:Hypothetical_protein [Hexamita inflata]|uniref:Hypothetical_protein n=1 Tax=Hexamita inflata TaxID=28002 RepID=A0AA86NQ65_9EUKA|nr:Hypothetical protein HINF_LOCUS11094 [Hexamita inflata]
MKVFCKTGFIYIGGPKIIGQPSYKWGRTPLICGFLQQIEYTSTVSNMVCGNNTIIYIYIYHSLNFRLYWFSIVFQTLRASKVCSFFQKKCLQKNESTLDSPVLLVFLALFLGLFLLVGILSVSKCLQCSRFCSEIIFLLEYSAMIFSLISLVCSSIQLNV